MAGDMVHALLTMRNKDLMMKRLSLSALCASAATLMGCAAPLTTPVVPVGVQYEPVGQSTATPDPTTTQQQLLAAGVSLGACLKRETFNKRGARVSSTTACGYANRLAYPNPSPAAMPQYFNMMTHDMRFDTPDGRVCDGQIVLVQPLGVKGEKLATAGTILPEWNNYRVPQGWAVPTQAVQDSEGRVVASSLFCQQRLQTSVPVIQ